MIVEYIRYRIPADRAEAFTAAYADAADLLQADPRCLGYEVSRSVVEPDRFVVRTEWESVDAHLGGFQLDAAFADFLALVRPYVGDIEERHHYEVQTTHRRCPRRAYRALYDWAGGHEAIAALTNAFYDRVEHDELLGPFFPGGVGAEHREHVAVWWSEVLGGPAQYTPAGGYPRMLAHHLGLNITVEQRRQFVTLLSIAADDAGLPDDPEFRAALVGYAEWATRLAMHNSQAGADVAREAPVPRWGWVWPRRTWIRSLATHPLHDHDVDAGITQRPLGLDVAAAPVEGLVAHAARPGQQRDGLRPRGRQPLDQVHHQAADALALPVGGHRQPGDVPATLRAGHPADAGHQPAPQPADQHGLAVQRRQDLRHRLRQRRQVERAVPLALRPGTPPAAG